jgi:hypothetical protein
MALPENNFLCSPESKWEYDKKVKKHNKQDFYLNSMICSAYNQGKEDQKDETKQMFFDKLNENLSKAGNICEQLYSLILKNNFKFHSAKLKSNNIYNFTALFLIDEEDFCNDDFSIIYDKSIEIKKEVNKSKTFNFSIIFMPHTENTDVDALRCDGYYLEFKPNATEKK